MPKRTHRHADVSKTEVHSIPLWILSGYTRELANKERFKNWSPLFPLWILSGYTRELANTLQYIKLRYSIEAPNKYLYCTVLFRTVLYKKEKICSQPDKETRNVSKTEVHSTRELANTLQYIKLRYSIEAPNKYLYCTVLFCTVLYKKEKICPQTKFAHKNQAFQKLKSTLRGSWPIPVLYCTLPYFTV